MIVRHLPNGERCTQGTEAIAAPPLIGQTAPPATLSPSVRSSPGPPCGEQCLPSRICTEAAEDDAQAPPAPGEAAQAQT